MFIDLAGLQTEDPVLDHIVTANAVSTRYLIQFQDQGKAWEILSVESDRDSLLEPDADLLHDVRSLRRRYRPGIDLLWWVECRVFQPAALDAPAPAVLIDAIGVFLPHAHRYVAFLCVADLPLAGQVHLAHRCNDIVPCGPEYEVKPELIVSFPGAAVCDLRGTFPLCDLHDLLGDQRAGKCCAHRVAFV